MLTVKEQYEESLRIRKDEVFAKAIENAVARYSGSDAGILSNEK